MKNWDRELDNRVAFLRQAMADSGATGLVYGNSGGKDATLVGILCRMATDQTVGVMMPVSMRNFESDKQDALMVAGQYGIQTRTVVLKDVAEAMAAAVSEATALSPMARANLSPRLRMMTLYAIAASENRLVVGTGNRSEGYMGYFTKWGDGAYDVNPVADLTVTEVYAFLAHLGAPGEIIAKAPSAGLYDGQTDEEEMGVSYAAIDRYITTGEAEPHEKEIIQRMHRASHHKRHMPLTYSDSSLL